MRFSRPSKATNRRRIRPPRPAAGSRWPASAATRSALQFEAVFGYDPSDPRESVVSSIPQALAMMNGPRLNLAIRAVDRDTVLGRLLEDIPSNELLVDE